MQNLNLSCAHLKKILEKLKQTLPLSKPFKSKQGYYYLTRKQNPDLFLLLKQSGFFLLHITNRRQAIVGYHQVVLFLHKGWKKLQFDIRIRKGQTEVHHIDHNPSNNSIENLAYTTPANNKAIATIVNICCDVPTYYGNATVKFDLNKVKMFHDNDFCKLLLASIRASSSYFDRNLFSDLLLNLPFEQSRLIHNRFLKLS